MHTYICSSIEFTQEGFILFTTDDDVDCFIPQEQLIRIEKYAGTQLVLHSTKPAAINCLDS